MAPAAEGAPPVPVRMMVETNYINFVGHLIGVERGAATTLPASQLDVLEEARLPAVDPSGQNLQ
jgi:hypothetical protein